MIAIALIIICLFIMSAGNNKTGSRGGPTINICNDGMRGHERRVAEFYGDDLDELEERFAEQDRRSIALEGMKEGETREFEGKKYTRMSVKDIFGDNTKT